MNIHFGTGKVLALYYPAINNKQYAESPEDYQQNQSRLYKAAEALARKESKQYSKKGIPTKVFHCQLDDKGVERWFCGLIIGKRHVNSYNKTIAMIGGLSRSLLKVDPLLDCDENFKKSFFTIGNSIQRSFLLKALEETDKRDIQYLT